ncbi:NGG1 interacting factor 3 like 1-like protein [Leptotrombidium deliense]|uniref:NIF3-like protein 1 n=1 Tax=Leptotrombidium deliense TaxID=299467 RepID=A0A443SQ45_9ACAR|nr:NGG1 interacting factor 3 like 1-like protein [Leptotrombidium deliense]
MEESTTMAVAVISDGQQEIESESDTQIQENKDDIEKSFVKNSYRQKYKRSWELDGELKDWLSPFSGDQYAAYCRACHCKLHAHKKGLLAHAKSSKHKKHLPDFDFEWLDPSYVPPALTSSSSSMNVSVVTYSNVNSSQLSTSMPLSDTTGIPLQDIVNHLQELAPLHLAGEWDNVGLLVQPSQPLKVHNVLLTIDLTEKVMEEALKKKINLIIAYHPPIFKPLKSLTTKSWKEKLMLTCVENRIAVYSPHTALDAVKGGVNDWLITAFGESQSIPIQQSYSDPKGSGHFSNCLDVLVSEGTEITNALSGLENVILTVKSNEYGGCDVRICCDDRTLAKVVEILSQHPVAQLCSRITKLQTPPLPGQGMGRMCTLVEPLPLYEIVHRTKQHIDQTHVRLALSPKHTRDTKVQSIAVCAGSGASVLKEIKADVFVTGEMSHHEVLDTIHSGTSVILCEHSNSERGYLKNWAEDLKSNLGQQTVNIIVSEADKDPLRIV